MKFNDLVQLIESGENLHHEVKYSNLYDGKRYKSAEGWFKGNQLHRLDGPAKITYYMTGQVNGEFWYKDGKLHRIGGPALIDYDYDENNSQQPQLWEFWVNGIPYAPSEYQEYMEKIKDLNPDEIDVLGDLGQTFE